MVAPGALLALLARVARAAAAAPQISPSARWRARSPDRRLSLTFTIKAAMAAAVVATRPERRETEAAPVHGAAPRRVQEMVLGLAAGARRSVMAVLALPLGPPVIRPLAVMAAVVEAEALTRPGVTAAGLS
jgi:hypothetical protein